MNKKIKLIIDSIIEDRIRITLIDEDNNERTIDIDDRALSKFLKNGKRIIEGRSYMIAFENDNDYEELITESGQALVASAKIEFEPKGKIDVKDTTDEDRENILKLQRKLGLDV